MLFAKSRTIEEYVTAPLVYAAVVQANHALWNPGDCTFIPAVFVFATDNTHKNDVMWLNHVASEINRLKNSAEVPSDMETLITTLRNDKSRFNLKIGKSVAGDAEAWCATHTFDRQNELPRKCLPSIGIVPFLLTPLPKDSIVIGTLMPSKYYISEK
jgi:hypothetical protein